MLTVLLGAGCTGGLKADHPSTSSAMSGSTSASQTDPAGKTAQSSRRDVDVLERVEVLSSRELRNLLTLTPDDTSIWFTSPLPQGEQLRQGHLEIRHGGKVRSIAAPAIQSRVSQVVSATALGERIVWRQTTSTSLDYEDFAIGTARLDGSGATIVATSARYLRHDRVLPLVGDSERNLTTDGLNAYWTIGKPVAKGDPPAGSVLLMAPLVGGTTVELARNVLFPTWAGTRLLVASQRRGLVAIQEVTSQGQRNTVASLALLSGEKLIDMCSAGRELALATTSPGAQAPHGRVVVTLLGEESGKSHQSWTRDVDGDGTSLACGDAILGWGNGTGTGDSKEYAVDWQNRHVVTLGEAEGLSVVLASGSNLAWSSLNADASKVTWTLAKWRGE